MFIRSNINFNDNIFLMFELDKMAYEFEKSGKEVIRMTLGKSELPVHAEINKAMMGALADFKKSSLVFPPGLPELKEKIAAYYEWKYHKTVHPKNVIISVGTSMAFRNLFYLLIKEPTDEVLLPLPYYSLYHFSALMVGAKIKYYDIDLQTLQFDRKSFEKNFTENTRLVVLNNPGNPLGNLLTRDDLLFIDSVVKGRAVVISDEIYDNMCFDEQSPSALELDKTASTFIVTNAFSKGYRMYSRRVGFCIVPDELVMPLTVIQHHTLLTTDPVVQYGAIAALEHQEEVDYIRGLYKSRRDYTLQAFQKVLSVKALLSRGSFYLTLDCDIYMKEKKIDSSLALATKIMEATNVATVPGSDFGLPRTLRLSFTTAKYKEGIDRLTEFFNKR